MLQVSQEWKDIQELAITTQSDVRISFFGTAGSTAETVLTGKDLKSFRYKQSGSIINKVIPLKEIYFECFMVDGRSYDFYKNQVCAIEFLYKYRDNSSWTSALVGCFRVSKKEIPANGLIAKYTLDNLFTPPLSGSTTFRSNDIQLDEVYTKGSNKFGKGTLNTDATIQLLAQELGCSTTDGSSVCGKTLGQVSKIDGLQMCAVALGKTLTSKRKNDTDVVPYNIEYTFIDIKSTSLTTYTIDNYILFEKAEFISDETVKELKVNVYTNAQAERVDVVDLVNCERFGTDVNESGDFPEAGYQNGYFGTVQIDPTKLWTIRDYTTDYPVAPTIDYNEIFIYSSFEGAEAVIASYMETNITTNVSILNVLGETILVDNCLINNNYKTNAIAHLTYGLNKNTSLHFKGRIDPSVELFDKITYSNDEEIYTLVVEDVEIIFNGGFQGEITARIISTNYYVKLNTPTITLNNTTLSITPVPNATSYIIYDNGNFYASTTSTTYSIAGMGSGTHAINVKATSSGYIDSDLSNFVYYSSALAQPSIILNGNMLTIICDPNATTNFIYANDTQVAQTNENYYDLRNAGLDAGTYLIKVKSTAQGYSESSFSSPVSYVVPLTAPVIRIDRDILSFEYVNHATNYDVYADDVVVDNITTNNLDLTTLGLSSGSHNIQVQAKASGYTSSALSNSVSWGTRLATPVISWYSADVITWSAITNATSYDIYINGSVVANVSTATYDLSSLTTGNYDVQVVAKASGYVDSNLSNTLTYRVPLATPTITISSAGVLNISQVPLAGGGYDIYADDVMVANTSSTTFFLSSLGLSGKDYAIKVKAVSQAYIHSDFSNVETYYAPLIAPTDLAITQIGDVSASVDDRSTVIQVIVDGVVIDEIDISGGN